MKNELKVLEFSKKKKLVDFVNTHPRKIQVVSISTSQMSVEFAHFLWYYEEE